QSRIRRPHARLCKVSAPCVTGCGATPEARIVLPLRWPRKFAGCMENQKTTAAAPQSESFDVVIVGGGPGGSTAGAYLAMAGRKVLILEREKFPRFHIGESMLPFSNDIFKETGVWPKLERGGFMPKLGAEFCTANGSRFQRFWFGRGIGPAYAQTFQVERARFDQVLLNHAASL